MFFSALPAQVSRCGRPISPATKARSQRSTCAGSQSSIISCWLPSRATRSTRLDTMLVIQTPPSASKARPSGKVPGPKVVTVSLPDSAPSAARRNRVSLRPKVSLTYSQRPEGSTSASLV